jgi:DNA-binding GntR family transcriptional regulator
VIVVPVRLWTKRSGKSTTARAIVLMPVQCIGAAMAGSNSASAAASRLSRQDFARAQRINDDLPAAHQAGDQLLARQLNREFHFVFYNGCGLPAVVAEIERFWGMFPWSELHIVRQSESFAEHRQILAAVIADDQPEIQRPLEVHMRNGYFALIKQLGHSVDVDPFEVSALE